MSAHREGDLYPATFALAKGRYDEAFHALDQANAEVAKSIPGCLGEQARQAEWIAGYQIVAARVLSSYGDGKIAHPLGTANRTTCATGRSQR